MPKIQKTADNSKYNRINLIYEKISNTTYGLTITELANELNVSTKTIQLFVLFLSYNKFILF